MKIFETKKRKRSASIKEYECIIRIGNEENSGREVSRQLNVKIKETFVTTQSCHDIESCIKQKFSQNILNGKPGKAYITAYRETQGDSFVIGFTVLVLTEIENYDEIHDVLLERLQELCRVFDRMLDKTYSVRHTLLQSATVGVDEKGATPPAFIRYALFLIVGLLALQVTLVVSPGIIPEKQMAQLRSIVKEELEHYYELQEPTLLQQNAESESGHKQIPSNDTEAGGR